MWRRRFSTVALGCTLSAVAAGCGGGGGGDASDTTSVPRAAGENLTVADVEKASARSSDLPSGYDDKGSGRRSAEECFSEADNRAAALVAEMAPYGLEACYQAKYSKKEGGLTNDVSSGAFVFRDAAAASQAMALLRKELINSANATGEAEVIGTEDLPVSGLGDEAPPGFQYTFDLLGQRAAAIAYVWRHGNVVAFFGGSDVLGDMNAESILAIARTIASRAG